MSRGLKLGAALICLAVCLAAPVMLLRGALDMVSYKNVLLAATAGWFVFATMWISSSKPRK